MSGSRKLNNKSNVISENLKKFRKESGYSQRSLCEKLELMGLQLYKADIYSIEHNKRSVKDFELLAFSIIFDKPIEDFLKMLQILINKCIYFLSLNTLVLYSIY